MKTGHYRRARIQCWCALCLSILEGRQFTCLEINRLNPQYQLFTDC